MYCAIHDEWPYCERCLAEEERDSFTDEDGYYGPREPKSKDDEEDGGDE